MEEEKKTPEYEVFARKLAQETSTDILLYSGPLWREYDFELIRTCKAFQPKNPNLLFLLTTFGGDPHVAYRIMRCLQNNYKKITIYIDTHCNSAGTLVALGADELVLSDYAELGPLDVQFAKPDEFSERSSGLTPTQALNTLANEVYLNFKAQFRKCRYDDPDIPFTTKTAALIAKDLTIGLFQPIYSQLDPMRLGEIDRELRVAASYGQRLNRGNPKKDTVGILVAGYPSHSFVIDRAEAKGLFNEVRAPTDEEEALASSLRAVNQKYLSETKPIFGFLNEQPAPKPAEEPSNVVKIEKDPKEVTTGKAG